MKTKNLFVILALFMISLCCISAVSAASEDIIDNPVSETDLSDESISISNEDDASDVEQTGDASIAQENNDEITLESTDEVLADFNQEQTVTADEDSILTYDGSSEKLSATGVTSKDFSVEFKDEVPQISSTSGGKINYYIKPCTKTSYFAYDFYLEVYRIFEENDDGIEFSDRILQKRLYSDSKAARTAKTYSYTFQKGYTTGLYLLVARNRMDNEVMDLSLLFVSGNIAISATDYNAYYNSDTPMTVKVTDKNNKKPINYGSLDVVFTKGKTTKEYSIDIDETGEFTFIPPVGAGTWTVTFTSGYDDHKATPLKKTITIKKPTVTMSAVKSTVQKGEKSVLKVTVKSQGKKVNEGTVTFKINGKTYKVNVKNGVATKKIKFGKAKTYTYTATFSGSNFQTPKQVSSKAVVIGPTAVKIVLNDLTAYTMTLDKLYKKVTVKILTTSGKTVKSGKLIIDGQEYEVENGKVYLQLWGLRVSDHYAGGSDTVKYFKTITKTVKVKYVPATNKYKSASKTIKIRYKFKCNICGKTTTHYHYDNGKKVKLVIS